MIEAALPIPADIAVHPGPLLRAAVFGALAAGAFALWPLARLEEVRPATLFRDAAPAGRALPRAPYLAAVGGLVAALVGAAALTTGEPILALWTAAAVAGSLVVLALAAAGVRWIARRSGRAARGRPALRAALAAIGGPRAETGAVVLSLGLGLTVLAAIGQVDTNLRSAIARDLPEVAPSFFFLDIQTDQLEGFRDLLAATPGTGEVESAPMLRGILTGINGRPAEEVAGDHWVLQGDRGVTYAATPGDSTITEGEWWPEDYGRPPAGQLRRQRGRGDGPRPRRRAHRQRPRPRPRRDHRQLPRGPVRDRRHRLHHDPEPRRPRRRAAHPHRHRPRRDGGRGRHPARRRGRLPQRDRHRRQGGDRAGVGRAREPRRRDPRGRRGDAADGVSSC